MAQMIGLMGQWVQFFMGWGYGLLPSPFGLNDWVDGLVGWVLPNPFGQNDWVSGSMG